MPKLPVYPSIQPPAVLWPCFQSASTTSPDLPIFVLGVLIAGRLFSVLFIAREKAEVCSETTFIVALSALAVCIKLSFLGLAASASLVAVGICQHRLRPPPFARVILASLLLWTAVTGVALAPWIARSVILSGYVAYPITAVPLPVQWKITYHMAEVERRFDDSGRVYLVAIGSLPRSKSISGGGCFSPR